jgi:peptide deformylase
MSRLEILHYPDPRLRCRAEFVNVVDDDIRRLIDDMLETMYDAPGIGLSAPQVNVAKRVVTIDLSKDRSAPLCLVNPEVRSTDGETETEEGCLSVPGVYELVKRPKNVRVHALDRGGRSREIEAEGMLAVCIQHEIDHLDGRLFVDYLSRLKRQRIRKKAEKALRYA